MNNIKHEYDLTVTNSNYLNKSYPITKDEYESIKNGDKELIDIKLKDEFDIVELEITHMTLESIPDGKVNDYLNEDNCIWTPEDSDESFLLEVIDSVELI